MDKNLRAELSALKEEVLANLKGLEKVIANIDSRLTQMDGDQMAPIEEMVDPNALADARAWVKDWDDAWELSNKRREEFLDAKRKPFEDPLGKKDLIDMFKEARRWDDWTYELFTTQWNKGKKQRIEGAINTINMFIADAKARKGSTVKVEDLNDAKRVLEEMERFDVAKVRLCDICQNTINDLNRLLVVHHDDADDFAQYYVYLNDLIEYCNAVKADLSDENIRIFGMLLSLLTTMLETNEMEQFNYVAVDPITFEPVKLDGDKLRKYRAVRLREYNRDLKNAFEFKAKREGRVVPSLDDRAIDPDTKVEPEVAASIPFERSEADRTRLDIVKDNPIDPLGLTPTALTHTYTPTADDTRSSNQQVVDHVKSGKPLPEAIRISTVELKKARDILREHEAAYQADLAVEKEREELLRLSKLVKAGADALAVEKA